ncbi:MAG: MBL fold metallo-hydrolase [Thermoprotei archaeon ex4572_64]|nr:MAG: MBL fold metallo-hydrolase [Thermoprotei archaeon ex4572_64]
MNLLEKLDLELVWFDSLGAKSACIAITSSIGKIIIDPGVAEMQPSYPLPIEEKFRLRGRALSKIENACKKAKVIIITHYHYDHHVLPDDPDIKSGREFYLNGKLLILKNPNMYINESQWNRARLFLTKILQLVNDDLSKYLTNSEVQEFEDPVEKLSIALSKDFKNYQARREELLKKGKKWFIRLKQLWGRSKWIIDGIKLSDNSYITWGDNKTFSFGDVEVRILEPWFHGIEYDRTGWVIPITIRKNNYTVFYSSDLMGPQIEDYAEFIIKLRPDIIILDGPPTYLYPYMLSKVNLERAVGNVKLIISQARPKLLIYDHHLLRDCKWRRRIEEVFIEAKKSDVFLLTAAEYLGDKPLIDKLCSNFSPPFKQSPTDT